MLKNTFYHACTIAGSNIFTVGAAVVGSGAYVGLSENADPTAYLVHNAQNAAIIGTAGLVVAEIGRRVYVYGLSGLEN